MSYKIHFLVQTSVSTSTGPLPGASITWPGGAAGPTGSDGKTVGTVEGSSPVACTATRSGYNKSAPQTGSSANDASNPLTFLLQSTGACFIVSAATGSPDSAEVRRMQQIRARVAALSGLTGRLIDDILREYYEFSPAIAADLAGNDAARNTVLTVVVRPLMAWFDLAVGLGLERSDASEVERLARSVHDVCGDQPEMHWVIAALKAIRSGEPLPEDAPQAIRLFAVRAQKAAHLSTASWALIEPLERLYSLKARQADLIDEVYRWLAAAPLQSHAPHSDPAVLDHELETLAGFFDARPAARRLLGTRLREAWPDAAPALEKHGFV